MNIKLYRSVFVLLIIMLVMVISPLASAQEEGASITLVLSLEPTTLDPQGTPHPSHAVMLPFIYDSLVFQDAQGNIHPFLAESWEIADDGLTLTFNLRSDVFFSNGNPVNADAVIFTFERLKEVGQRSLVYGEIMNIGEFEKVSDKSVSFHLNSPSASLLSALSYAFAGILDQEAVEAAGEEYGINPVGSGPFMLAAWTPQNNLELVPNPYYAGQRFTDSPGTPSNITELNLRFSSDPSTSVNALLNNETDIIYVNSASQLPQVEGNDDFTIFDNPSRGLTIIGFNTGRAPFDDVNLRQAVAMAVNKVDMQIIAAPGLSQLVNTPLPPTIFGYDEELEAEALAYDVDAAKALVAASDYDGETILIISSTYPLFRPITTILQAQLVEIGINAEIQILDRAANTEAAAAGEYDIMVTLYNWNDPDVLRMYLHSDSIGGRNRYFYSNTEFDELVIAGKSEFDAETRFAIYGDAQRIIMDEVPWLPLFMTVQKVVINNRIQNAEIINSAVILDNAIVDQ
jgi:peptide/nickel transport system substrate-binding protein